MKAGEQNIIDSIEARAWGDCLKMNRIIGLPEGAVPSHETLAWVAQA